MELLHISLHLCLWERKKKQVYIGMKTIWIWFQGEFYLNAYPKHAPPPKKKKQPTPSIAKKNDWILYVIYLTSAYLTSALLIHL